MADENTTDVVLTKHHYRLRLNCSAATRRYMFITAEFLTCLVSIFGTDNYQIGCYQDKNVALWLSG
jgi:hypothetical protein